MHEDQMQVLELLSQGKITVEDAEKLMAALQGEAEPVAEHAAWPTDVASPGRQRVEDKRRNQDRSFANLTPDQLVSLRVMGVSPEYVQEMRELGFPDITADQLISLYNDGVDAKYIREMHAAGFENLSVDQFISLYSEGVNAEYARKMRLQFPDVTPDQLVSLYSEGVDAGFVKDVRKGRL